ncbi:MAG: hypothetical protein R2699_03600 [Acidimicrobiales bacterium]
MVAALADRAFGWRHGAVVGRRLVGYCRGVDHRARPGGRLRRWRRTMRRRRTWRAVAAALPAGDGAGAGDDDGASRRRGLRLLCVRLAAVMAFVDGRVDDAKMTRVLALARALGVHADFVTAVHELLVGEVAWVAADQIRHNIATIPGVPYDQAHPYAAFLPYTDGREDPALAARYDALADLPDGSLGKAFYEHYTRNGFAFLTA